MCALLGVRSHTAISSDNAKVWLWNGVSATALGPDCRMALAHSLVQHWHVQLANH